jgi:hypothetical protein
MKITSIRSALGGAVCLLAGFFVGCSDEGGQAPPGSGPAKHAAPSAAVNSSAKPSAADAAAKPSVTAVVNYQEPPDPVVKAGAMPAKTVAKSGEETVAVGACDGGNAVEVPKTLVGKPLADSLMDDWKHNHPEATWVKDEEARHALKPSADNANLLQGGQAKGDTYGNFTPRDLLTWQRETEKFVVEGSRIFHSGDELGSTVAVSCDMCHPDAANTHPETYPKYQAQLGRVVLLRDMINWCVENPVRAKKLEPDGEKMRALEAYIMAQRKGVAMDYGKH